MRMMKTTNKSLRRKKKWMESNIIMVKTMKMKTMMMRSKCDLAIFDFIFK